MNLTYLVLSDFCYQKLASAAIQSILKNTQDDVYLVTEKIFDGLPTDPRLTVETTDAFAQPTRVHDQAWVRNVSLKVRFLRELVRENNRVILLDADCLVFKDPISLINCNFAINVCRRDKPVLRETASPSKNCEIAINERMDYIASFFFANGAQSIPFLDAWIEEIDFLSVSSNAPFETPALCRTLSHWKFDEIHEIYEQTVSRQQCFDAQTYIGHLKSRSRHGMKDIVQERLSLLDESDKRFVRPYFEIF